MNPYSGIYYAKFSGDGVRQNRSQKLMTPALKNRGQEFFLVMGVA
jgi:hypothetical protein